MNQQTDHENFEEPKPGFNKLYAAAAVATLIVAVIRGVTLLQSAESDTPKVPAPAETSPEKSATPVPKPAKKVETVKHGEKPAAPKPDKAKAVAATEKEPGLWQDYLDTLKKGRADEAVTIWASWKVVAMNENGGDWEAKLEGYWPKEDQRVLVLNSTCSACSDGSCETCKSTGKCHDCHGERNCENCKGAQQFVAACNACLCKTCNMTGHCTTCQGYGKLACKACNGTGLGKPVVRTETCRACGGKGQVKRKYRDSFFVCQACNGHGKFSQSMNTTCTTCKGAKAEPCTNCKATGLCPNCRGTRRNPTCSICKATGKIVTVCSTCKGAGTCNTCGGLGLCKACNGLAKCPACLGNNVNAYKRLIVSKDFLPENAQGIVVDDKGWRTFTLTDEKKPSVQCAGRRCVLETGDHIFNLVSDRNAFHLLNMNPGNIQEASSN